MSANPIPIHEPAKKPRRRTSRKAAQTPRPEVEEACESQTPAEHALNLLRAGESELRVRTVLAHRNLHEPVITDAIEQAYAEMRKSWEARSPRDRMSLALEQRSRVIAEAMAASDWRIALTAMEQREKLQGLTGPDAIEETAASLLDLVRLASESHNLTDCQCKSESV